MGSRFLGADSPPPQGTAHLALASAPPQPSSLLNPSLALDLNMPDSRKIQPGRREGTGGERFWGDYRGGGALGGAGCTDRAGTGSALAGSGGRVQISLLRAPSSPALLFLRHALFQDLPSWLCQGPAYSPCVTPARKSSAATTTASWLPRDCQCPPQVGCRPAPPCRTSSSVLRQLLPRCAAWPS